jgi:hypothetical protein
MSNEGRVKLIQYTIVASLILSASPPIKARAADPRFCENYARAAPRQIDVAEHECGNLANPGISRWSGGYRDYYDWCLAVSYRQPGDEREARREGLDICRRH